MTDIELLLADKLTNGSMTLGDADTVRDFATFLDEAGPPPGHQGYDRARAIRALARYAPDQVADMYLDTARELQAGARERTELEQLLVRIRDHVYAGSRDDGDVRRGVLLEFEQDPQRWRPGTGTAPARPSARPRGVTDRDVELLALFADGHTAKAVAHRVDQSERNIRRRVRLLCDRLGTRTIIQAVAWAIRAGVI